MPFVKVVEGHEIYNFGIGHLGHFSLNFWRNYWSKWASPKFFCHSAVQSACRRRRRALSPRVPGWARTPRPSSDPWSMRGALVTVLQDGRRGLEVVGRCHAARPNSPVRACQAATGCSVRHTSPPPLAHVVPMPQSVPWSAREAPHHCLCPP
jgi:hypothetical protein